MNITSHLGDDLLNAWIDGETTAGESSIIEEHLASCAVCRDELSSLRVTKQLLAELPEPQTPRSFQLSAEQANSRNLRTKPASPSNVVRMLPIVRVLSIAAVLAVLVLGGATAFGPVSDAITGNGTDMSSNSVTNPASGASEETSPDRMAIVPGEVVDQGQSASSSNSAMNSMENGLQSTESDATGQLSPLEIATLGSGILAIIMIGLWIVLSQLSRSRPSELDRSGH